MAYAEELNKKKEELEEQLKNELYLLEQYRKNAKEKEIITEALQNQIDGIDCELRGEANR